ncbi:hypothetical protein KJ359_005346 [Pestalotiopsis sp. 9143b]|nr:hypothetical protein KJ359_005346 [Pestalotiopsis sp. 9143b]
MSRQPNQNAGQKADAFSETFRMAKEAEDLRLAKEKADKNTAAVAYAREMHNGFTKGGSKGSGSIRGRGSRGRQAASSAAPHHVKTPTKGPQEFTTSAYTSRKGVNTDFPGRGGFSPGAGGIFSSDNRQRENQGWVGLQGQRLGNHQVAGSHQQEKQYPMSHQTHQAATHQVAGFKQQETERPMGHQTLQHDNYQVAGLQQQEYQHRMGHQTFQSVNNQYTGVQQQENQRLMGSQTQQAATHQVAGVQQQNNQRLMDPLQPIDNQVVNHHAEAMSTGNDVDMVDAEAYTGSRKNGMNPRVTKHGGIEQSRWANAETKNAYAPTTYGSPMSDRGFKGMTSTSTQKFADDEDPERWVPYRISHPTPMPSHLVQRTQTRSGTTSNGAAVTRRVNAAPRIQATASSAGSRPSTGPRGGLANSQWA